MIKIASCSKHFGPVRAVDDVTSDIERGEFFSLLGASGCGKTTLLRLLAGFEQPTFGNIFIDSQGMAGVPPNLRPTNMVFQSYAIFPHLDVRRNIAYGLRQARLSRKELDHKVDEMLELIKLPGFGGRAAHQLSGGQRQRVALARALIKRPKVLLLDEPLGALDKKLREEMQLELRALQRNVGITFVFVTHDQEEALTMSDRIAVMAQGHVLQIDTPTGLYENPNCKEVAAFIGTMNFFDAKARGPEGAHMLIDAGPLGNVRARANGAVRPAPGAPVTVALRPEKINLSTSRPNVEHNFVEGRMSAAAYLGDRSHYYIRIQGRAEPVAVAAQNLEASSDLGKPDQAVWLSWRDDSIVLLDR